MKVVLRWLGFFTPSHFDENTIHRELTKFLADRRIPYHGSIGTIRNPNLVSKVAKAPPIQGNATPWHQDCNGSQRGMIVWSNVYPTYFRLIDRKRIIRFPRGSVVFADNHAVEHRSPWKLSPKAGRWFARTYSDSKPPLKIL